jgi:two-component system, response regulator, stage 0 sporulation protein A
MENQIVTELIQEIQFLRKEVSELKSITLGKNEVVEVEVDLPSPVLAHSLTERLDARISELLIELNVPRHVCGYVYIREALNMVCLDFGLLQGITKNIYPAIAKKCNTLPNRVERGIRTAIELSWYKSNHPMYTHSLEKPTNSEFIAMLADKIRLEEKIS